MRVVVRYPEAQLCSATQRPCVALSPGLLQHSSIAPPWSGHGWRFECTVCEKPFTLGMVNDLAGVDHRHFDVLRQRAEGSRQLAGMPDVRLDVSDLAYQNILALEDVMPGTVVTYLDGAVLPLDASPVRFSGIYAQHNFVVLPQLLYERDPKSLRRYLSRREYWERRRVMRATP